MDGQGQDELLDAIELDDSFTLVRVLAETPGGRTELVRRSGATDLLVRKRMPTALANESAWRALEDVSHPRLPQLRELYWLPDVLVAVYDFVPGRSLRDLVAERGCIAPAEAVDPRHRAPRERGRHARHHHAGDLRLRSARAVRLRRDRRPL